jgi:hypothetical protein
MVLGKIISDNYLIFKLTIIYYSWFLAWLLILNYIYCQILVSSSSSNNEENYCIDENIEFPSTLKRMFYGITICGGMTYVVISLFSINDTGQFISMPITIGSLPCDILMFITGVFAKRNNWFNKPIREQLDIPVWLLRLIVLIEGAIIVILLPQAEKISIILIIFLFCILGMFCLDMCLCILEFFQSYCNYHSVFTDNMSKSAYTVYLIHPLIVTLLTTVFIVIYDGLYANSTDERLAFNDSNCSSTTLIGPYKGSIPLAIGFISVAIIANIILWPLSNSIRKLPYLNKIL